MNNNLSNLLTISRIAIIPIILVLIIFKNPITSWVAFILFVIADQKCSAFKTISANQRSPLNRLFDLNLNALPCLNLNLNALTLLNSNPLKHLNNQS